MIPGMNVLAMAHQLIGFQTAQHRKNRGMVDGADGINNPNFYPPVPIQGSIQPIPRNMYQQLELDLQRNYVTFYTSVKLSDLKRDKAPDLVDFNGRRYQVESNTDWTNQDHWAGSICVDVGSASQ